MKDRMNTLLSLSHSDDDLWIPPSLRLYSEFVSLLSLVRYFNVVVPPVIVSTPFEQCLSMISVCFSSLHVYKIGVFFFFFSIVHVWVELVFFRLRCVNTCKENLTRIYICVCACWMFPFSLMLIVISPHSIYKYIYIYINVSEKTKERSFLSCFSFNNKNPAASVLTSKRERILFERVDIVTNRDKRGRCTLHVFRFQLSSSLAITMAGRKKVLLKVIILGNSSWERERERVRMIIWPVD